MTRILAKMLLGMCSLVPDGPKKFSCLPAGIKPTDVVSAEMVSSGKGGDVVKKVRVTQRLKEMKARCRKGMLVDAAGREIRFHRLVGCWGNPPVDYQEILERQRKELEELRKQYTVIEMTCNPSGLPIP